jgi:ribosome-binding protein aMBF1 (putative translation factor)
MMKDDLDRFIHEQLKDPEFAKEWEKSKAEREVKRLIVDARCAQNMTQAELAQRTGIKQPNISRIENGTTSPTLSTLEALAEGLGKKLEIRFA